MQKFSHITHSFDGFTLDLTRGCLLRGTQEVKLAPKPFDALKYLVENPGRLISKAELIESIWPDTAVTDDSLVQCLREVRRVLGDEAQQIIKTVPRRGYIFDREVRINAPSAPVTTYTEETGVQLLIEEEETNGHAVVAVRPGPVSANALLTSQPQTGGLQRISTAIKQHKWAASFVVLALALAISGIVYVTRPDQAIDSVAVIPFSNVSGDPKLEYIADGMSDGIINNLSQLQSLKRVIAFNSVLRYKGKPPDPQTVARDLNVRAVLVGRVTQNGDNLSIAVELVDTRDNRRLWGEQFDRKMSDLTSFPGELAREVTDHLRLKLTPTDQQQLEKQYTQNTEAYQLYLKGLFFWNKSTRQADEKAIEFFQQSIDKDQNYALAYLGLANCYLTMADFDILSSADGYAKARLAANKALVIDNTLAEAHGSLAKIKFSYDWDWAGAEQEYRLAFQLNPNSAHAGYASYLSVMGRHQEAIAEAKLAQEVDPLSLRINAALGRTLFVARRYDEAIEQARKTLELESNFIKAHRQLGLSYEQKGMYPEAIAEFQKIGEISGGEGGVMALGHAYAVAGRRNDAMKVLDDLSERAKHQYVAAFSFAMIYTGLGEKDKAFEWLEKSFVEHDSNLIDLKIDPRFDTLRSDPRFTALLSRMKLDS